MQTHGTRNCRIGGEVVLNSDRWLRMTTTYGDLDEYRAYVVDHEVGHFLGHDHADCPGKGEPAPRRRTCMREESSPATGDIRESATIGRPP